MSTRKKNPGGDDSEEFETVYIPGEGVVLRKSKRPNLSEKKRSNYILQLLNFIVGLFLIFVIIEILVFVGGMISWGIHGD